MTRTRLIFAIVLAAIILPSLYIWHIRTIDIEVKDNKIFVDGQDIAQKNYSAGFFGQLYGQDAVTPETDFSTEFLAQVYGKDSKGRGLRKFLASHGMALNQNLVIHFNSGQTMDRYLTILQNIIWPTNYEGEWSWSSDMEARSLQIASLLDLGVSPGDKKQIVEVEKSDKQIMEEIEEQMGFFAQHMSVYLTGTDADGQSAHLAMTRELPMFGTTGYRDVVNSESNSGAKNEPTRGINELGPGKLQLIAAAKQRAAAVAKKTAARDAAIERQVSLIVTKQDVFLIKMDSVVYDIAAKDGGFDLSALPSQLELAIRGDSTGMIFVGSDADVDVGWILTILRQIQKTPSASAWSLSDRVPFGRNIHISKDKILHQGEPLEANDKAELIKSFSTLTDQRETEYVTGVYLESHFGVEFDRNMAIVIDQDASTPVVIKVAQVFRKVFRPILILPGKHRVFTYLRHRRVENRYYSINDISDLANRSIRSNIIFSEDGSTKILGEQFPKQAIEIPAISGQPNFPEIEKDVMSLASAIRSASTGHIWEIFVDPNDSVEVNTLLELLSVLKRASAEYDTASIRTYANIGVNSRNTEGLASLTNESNKLLQTFGYVVGVSGEGRLAISRISISGAGVGASASEIQSVIDQNGPAINSCYQKELKKWPDIIGILSIQIKINKAGKVAGVTPTQNTVGDAVAQCVTNKIRGWSFPKGKTGVITVNVTFTFEK